MENNGKELKLDSMYLVQDALKSKRAMESRNRNLEFEDEYEVEDEFQFSNSFHEFISTVGVTVVWFTIMFLAFWLGLGGF